MSRPSIALLALLALGTTLSAQAETMKPGLWEISVSSDMGGGHAMPAIPPEQLAEMQKRGIKLPPMAGGQPMLTRHCVSKEQAERGEPPQPRDDARMKCERTDLRHEGNTVKWKMHCTGEREAWGEGFVTYAGATAYSGNMQITVKDAAHGNMTMNQKYSGKWLGADCRQ
ncbi:MAG: DUF3617 domain-containing protein [Rhodocyclaceae bacterium]|nr:DUF3617 domain-containing protein [Rhodocyclaceae bacterium]MBX3670150.1 DUF3617 domain-containing protein [Rhodocyclaceae bacterium]